MRYFSLIAFLFFFFSCAPLLGAQGRPICDSLNQGQVHLSASQYQAAAQSFLAATQQPPRDSIALCRSEALKKLALTVQYLGQWDSAIYWYELALNEPLMPKWEEAYIWNRQPYDQRWICLQLAELYAMQRNYEQSSAYLQRIRGTYSKTDLADKHRMDFMQHYFLVLDSLLPLEQQEPGHLLRLYLSGSLNPWSDYDVLTNDPEHFAHLNLYDFRILYLVDLGDGRAAFSRTFRRAIRGVTFEWKRSPNHPYRRSTRVGLLSFPSGTLSVESYRGETKRAFIKRLLGHPLFECLPSVAPSDSD